MRHGDPVSVIMPCHNREGTVGRAVEGVLGQTYPALELIVVDDASTDRSAEVVAEIAARDPRVRLIRLERNLGAAGARNVGIEAATGEILAFQDSDDEWFPQKLDVQMRAFAALPEDYVAVFCTKIIYGRDIADTGAKRYGVRRASCVPGPEMRLPADGDLSEAFLWGNFMGPPTVVLKKAAFHAAGGFDRRLRNNNDWDLNLRLSRQGRIHFVDQPLMLVHDSADGISKNPVAKAFSTIVIFGKIKRHRPDTPALAPTALAVHRFLVMKGKPRLARRFLRKALALRPRSPGLWARLLLSHLPGTYARLVRGRFETRRRRG